MYIENVPDMYKQMNREASILKAKKTNKETNTGKIKKRKEGEANHDCPWPEGTCNMMRGPTGQE